jgi:hypothetical protein
MSTHLLRKSAATRRMDGYRYTELETAAASASGTWYWHGSIREQSPPVAGPDLGLELSNWTAPIPRRGHCVAPQHWISLVSKLPTSIDRICTRGRQAGRKLHRHAWMDWWFLCSTLEKKRAVATEWSMKKHSSRSNRPPAGPGNAGDGDERINGRGSELATGRLGYLLATLKEDRERRMPCLECWGHV